MPPETRHGDGRWLHKHAGKSPGHPTGLRRPGPGKAESSPPGRRTPGTSGGVPPRGRRPRSPRAGCRIPRRSARRADWRIRTTGRSPEAPPGHIRVATVLPLLGVIGENCERPRHQVAGITSRAVRFRRRRFQREAARKDRRAIDHARKLGERRRPSAGPCVITRQLSHLTLAYERHDAILYTTTSRARRGWWRLIRQSLQNVARGVRGP